jgi:hypothetical protein
MHGHMDVKNRIWVRKLNGELTRFILLYFLILFIVHSALNLFRNTWHLSRNIYNSNKATLHNQSSHSGNV